LPLKEATAQQANVKLRPDIGAPGMTMVIEALARTSALQPFGLDGVNANLPVQVVFVRPQDSARIILGPPQARVVSSKGRLLQIPIFISQNADTGAVRFVLFSPVSNFRSDTLSFTIAKPQKLGVLNSNVTIGLNRGSLSVSNVLLVDSLIAIQANILFSLNDPDTLPGNPRLEPVSIFSLGPVRLSNTVLSVDAKGLNGGPGGGAGGHGYDVIGGIGFTGGGSSSDTITSSNQGSGGEAEPGAGGASVTGVAGGGSTTDDQGGGGGTGAPYGSSGAAGVANNPSSPGGFGGGSAGGENIDFVFGGGGGGFGTAGVGGIELSGPGQNGGHVNGGRFLVPLSGGSGGGAGNSVNASDPIAGSGGGGGGSLAIVGYDSIYLVATSFSAKGDSGTTGQSAGSGRIARAASGGGGSGGSIVLQSSKGIDAFQSNIFVDGGRGGQRASDSAFAGGAGGWGRIRIDGPNNFAPFGQAQSVTSNGLSITPDRKVQAGPFIRVSGFAQDPNDFYDSVRIYFRTSHGAWQFVDTVRVGAAWSKWLPAGHDSLLYAIAMIKVFDPSSDFANYEPEWLVSHVSMGLFRHVPTSNIVLQQDTLDFGSVHLTHCTTRKIIIRNEGEAPLTIDSTVFTNSSFTYVGSKRTISGYATDTIEIQFCPDTAKRFTDTLYLYTNDTANRPKRVVLRGVGLARKDSLSIVPMPLDFGNVKLGTCKSITVKLKAEQTDSVYLNFKKVTISPFTFELVPADTILAPDSSADLVVTFCPTDTGSVSRAAVLDERNDSLIVKGRGVVRALEVKQPLGIRSVCASHPAIFTDTLINKSNDTMTVFSVVSASGGKILSDTVLAPNDTVLITWTIPVGNENVFVDSVFYRASDTTFASIVRYRSFLPAIPFDSAILFHFTCVGSPATIRVDFKPTGETVRILNPHLLIDTVFSIVGSIDTTNVLTDTQSLFIRYDPRRYEPNYDTLVFTVSDIVCDSIYRIPVSGIGVKGPLGFEDIHFDTVIVGNCVDDSLLVQNSCGADDPIDSIEIHDPSFQRVTVLPVTVPSNNSIRLQFRFCPTSPGLHRDTIRIFADTIFTAILEGYAVERTSPWAYFSIDDEPPSAGDRFTTSIRLDSSSLVGVHSFVARVSYDPLVLYPTGVGAPFPPSLVARGAVEFSGALNFQQFPQSEQIEWLALLGPHDRSTLHLDVTMDTPLVVYTKDGLVTVVDCSNLPGQVRAAGSYALGPVTPNPLTDHAEVQMELGADGMVEAEIYDLTGRHIETVFQKYFQRGSYQLTIPFADLNSGKYMLVMNSMGWRALRFFLLER